MLRNDLALGNKNGGALSKMREVKMLDDDAMQRGRREKKRGVVAHRTAGVWAMAEINLPVCVWLQENQEASSRPPRLLLVQLHQRIVLRPCLTASQNSRSRPFLAPPPPR